MCERTEWINENVKVLKVQGVCDTLGLRMRLDAVYDQLPFHGIFVDRALLSKIFWGNQLLTEGVDCEELKVDWDDELYRLVQNNTAGKVWVDDMLGKVNLPRTTLMGLFFSFREFDPTWNQVGDVELISRWMRPGFVLSVESDLLAYRTAGVKC